MINKSLTLARSSACGPQVLRIAAAKRLRLARSVDVHRSVLPRSPSPCGPSSPRATPRSHRSPTLDPETTPPRPARSSVRPSLPVPAASRGGWGRRQGKDGRAAFGSQAGQGLPPSPAHASQGSGSTSGSDGVGVGGARSVGPACRLFPGRTLSLDLGPRPRDRAGTLGPGLGPHRGARPPGPGPIGPQGAEDRGTPSPGGSVAFRRHVHI